MSVDIVDACDKLMCQLHAVNEVSVSFGSTHLINSILELCESICHAVIVAGG
jgi:hypothetical protein